MPGPPFQDPSSLAPVSPCAAGVVPIPFRWQPALTLSFRTLGPDPWLSPPRFRPSAAALALSGVNRPEPNPLGPQVSSIPAGSTSHNVTVARAFTKLLGAFVSFRDIDDANLGECSNFEHPGDGSQFSTSPLESQMQLGALQYPRYPMASDAEHFHFLEILAGTYDSSIKNMRIADNLWNNTQFIAAFPVERVPKHPLSGISTRSGDLARFTFKGMVADRVQRMYIHLLSYQIVTVSGSGVSVLD